MDANTLKQFNARALIEPSAVQKMHPKLFTGDLPGWALKSGGSVNVWISFARSFDLQLVKNELARLNFDIESDIYKDYRVLSITLSLTRLEELASLPFIEYAS